MPFNKKIHLVGSIPLSSTSEVFQTIPSSLPNLLTRIPDGETGVRGSFIMWQTEVFANCQWVMPPILRSKPFDPVSEKDSIKLRGTGYDTRAIESYQLFCKARRDGLISTGAKFLIGLPPPLDVVACFILPQYQVKVEKLYEAALLSSLWNIQDSIPKEDLSIQWDMPIEFAFLEFAKLEGKQEWVVAPYDAFISKPWFRDVEKEILERIVKLCEHVDQGVEMGFHFCYGDMAHKHFIEPTSTATMVSFANALALSLPRTIDYIHMPIPKSATSPTFFAPLKDIKLDEKTEMHLGLIHTNDLDGTKERIDVAEKYLDRGFGASTECGCGRTSNEDFESILDICRTICQ